MTLIHEVKGEDAYGLMSVLFSTRGFYTGNIIFNRPIRPEMGLSDSIKQQNETYELFEQHVVQTVAARYSAVYNTPMIILAQMFAVGRYPTNEEIEHDLDHFGIEQMLWPKDYFAKQEGVSIDKIDPKLPRYNFPKGSWMGDEEYIYVGPMRMKYAQCATFIDRYPIRTSLEYMLDVIQGMKLKDEALEKNQVVGDGGFIIAATNKGVVSYQKGRRESAFGTEDIPVHDKAHIHINKLHENLQEHIAQHGEDLEDHIQLIKSDFVEKWPYEFHHGYPDVVESHLNLELESMEKWYLKFYKDWERAMHPEKKVSK